MSVFDPNDPAALTPSGVWASVDEPTRLLAARAMYAGDRALAKEADAAIAAALRFREVAVRQMPRDKRAGYLVARVPTDDSLASSLLMALHLTYRTELLGAFLDALQIPHEGGLIDPDHDLEAADPAAFGDAVGALYDRFPAAEVELYVASLVAMDPDAWRSLAEHIRPSA